MFTIFCFDLATSEFAGPERPSLAKVSAAGSTLAFLYKPSGLARPRPLADTLRSTLRILKAELGGHGHEVFRKNRGVGMDMDTA